MKTAVMTRPTTSIPRCRPTLWRSWWTTGRRSQRERLREVSDAVDISVPHSRVEEGRDDVDHEVGECDDHREQHHHALHGDEVACLQVVHELEAEAFPLEG